jgi:hypothetical protein
MVLMANLPLRVVIVSAIRLRYVFETGAQIPFAITGCIEPTVGIIVACTPMVRTVVEHLSGGRVVLWGTSDRKYSSSSGTSKMNISWPQSAQKTYISSVKISGAKGFETIDEGDVPLVTAPKSANWSSREISNDGRDWSSFAEEGRIRVTRDVVVDNRPKTPRRPSRP